MVIGDWPLRNGRSEIKYSLHAYNTIHCINHWLVTQRIKVSHAAGMRGKNAKLWLLAFMLVYTARPKHLHD